MYVQIKCNFVIQSDDIKNFSERHISEEVNLKHTLQLFSQNISSVFAL